MVNKAGNSKFSFNHFIGPLLDDGALCSGIVIDELKIISPYLHTSWNGELDPIPSVIGYQLAVKMALALTEVILGKR